MTAELTCSGVVTTEKYKNSIKAYLFIKVSLHKSSPSDRPKMPFPGFPDRLGSLHRRAIGQAHRLICSDFCSIFKSSVFRISEVPLAIRKSWLVLNICTVLTSGMLHAAYPLSFQHQEPTQSEGSSLAMSLSRILSKILTYSKVWSFRITILSFYPRLACTLSQAKGSGVENAQSIEIAWRCIRPWVIIDYHVMMINPYPEKLWTLLTCVVFSLLACGLNGPSVNRTGCSSGSTCSFAPKV